MFIDIGTLKILGYICKLLDMFQDMRTLKVKNWKKVTLDRDE